MGSKRFRNGRKRDLREDAEPNGAPQEQAGGDERPPEQAARLRARLSAFPPLSPAVGWRWAKAGSGLFWKCWRISVPSSLALWALWAWLFVSGLREEKAGGLWESFFGQTAELACLATLSMLLALPMHLAMCANALGSESPATAALAAMKPKRVALAAACAAAWACLASAASAGIGLGIAQIANAFPEAPAAALAGMLAFAAFGCMAALAAVPFAAHLSGHFGLGFAQSMAGSAKLSARAAFAWFGAAARFGLFAMLTAAFLGSAWMVRSQAGSVSVGQQSAAMAICALALAAALPQLAGALTAACLGMAHCGSRREYGGDGDERGDDEDCGGQGLRRGGAESYGGVEGAPGGQACEEEPKGENDGK